MYFNDKMFTIYAIRCKGNGKLYIGRTCNLDSRIQTHFCELKSGRHNSKTMVEDFKKYGREHFEVYILEENIPYKERFKEYEYMRTYNSFDENYGYNRGDRKKKNKKIINYIHSMPPNLCYFNKRRYIYRKGRVK